MSNVTTIARPYARAVFEVAHGEGQLAAWADALDLAGAVAGNSQVLQLAGDPRVAEAGLAELFQPASGDGPQGYRALIELLIENDRLAALPEIAHLFHQLKNAAEKTLQVTVRSAIALANDYVERLKSALERRFGCDVTLHCQVDPALLGGAVIQAGDRVVDGSLKDKLQRLSDQLAR